MDQNINQNGQMSNTNGMATTGLIVSMVSIFVPMMGLMGLMGVIFSIIGLIQSKKLNGVGKIYSILGIIIGVVGIIYGVYYFVTSLSEMQEKLNEVYSFLKLY